MGEKLRFVFEYERDEESMKALCERFGVSRETGYVWLRRYRQSGPEGLVEVNRAPLRHPNQPPVSIEEAVLGPATSTMGEIVKRAGLVVERRKRRRTEPYTEPLAHAVESNKVWCGDFKGWFRSGDGTRIDPLTITDACSRYLLRSQAVEKTDTERVRSIFEAAFREYGLPWAMRTDNGAPFADFGPLLTRLTELGATRRELSLFARAIAYRGAFNTLYALEDPGIDEKGPSSLYESILSADPSGREGRPGSAPAREEQRQVKDH
jgi:transposase-like protein